MQGTARAVVMVCLIVGAGIVEGYALEGYATGTRICVGMLYGLIFFMCFFPMESQGSYHSETRSRSLRLPRWLRAVFKLKT